MLPGPDTGALRISLALAVFAWILVGFWTNSGASSGRIKGGLAAEGVRMEIKTVAAMITVAVILVIFEMDLVQTVVYNSILWYVIGICSSAEVSSLS